MKVALLFLALGLGGSLEAPRPERPNLVLMMCDDQRWDALSCAGNPVIKTPNMDRLAKEGMLFRNMFVINSLCAPSRATILTGTYSHTHGVIDNKGRPISPEVPWMPDLLRQAGYEVAFCGKSHQQKALRDRSWDYYFGYRGQGRYLNPQIAEGTDGKDTVYPGWMDDVVTEKAIEWLKKPREKPFCLFLWFKACHRSWVRPERLAHLYEDVTVPKPPSYDDPAEDKTEAFRKADNKVGAFKDVADYQKFMKDYYATIVGADENVGRVLSTLGALGKLDETVVMHTGDNGFFLGEWGRFDKRFMHEVSIRVPLLVRYPKRIKAGSVSDRMVLNLDFAPTLLDLAGLPVPRAMQGHSWMPLLRGEEAGWRKDWLYEYFEYPAEHSVRKHRGVRSERYKLIHYHEEPQEYELYDLGTDPDERKNRYGDPALSEVAEGLKLRIEELRRETGDR